MTREEKDLLLKDLCARLPYGVICRFTDTFDGCEVENVLHPDDITDMLRHRSHCDSRIDVKPYLRPMSSMTEEEKREIYNWLVENDVDWFDFSKLRLDEILISFDSSWLLVNWLLKNHFDFMGLIPKGRAIAVTKDNNPYKD